MAMHAMEHTTAQHNNAPQRPPKTTAVGHLHIMWIIYRLCLALFLGLFPGRWQGFAVTSLCAGVQRSSKVTRCEAFVMRYSLILVCESSGNRTLEKCALLPQREQ